MGRRPAVGEVAGGSTRRGDPRVVARGARSAGENRVPTLPSRWSLATAAARDRPSQHRSADPEPVDGCEPPLRGAGRGGDRHRGRATTRDSARAGSRRPDPPPRPPRTTTREHPVRRRGAHAQDAARHIARRGAVGTDSARRRRRGTPHRLVGTGDRTVRRRRATRPLHGWSALDRSRGRPAAGAPRSRDQCSAMSAPASGRLPNGRRRRCGAAAVCPSLGGTPPFTTKAAVSSASPMRGGTTPRWRGRSTRWPGTWPRVTTLASRPEQPASLRRAFRCFPRCRSASSTSPPRLYASFGKHIDTPRPGPDRRYTPSDGPTCQRGDIADGQRPECHPADTRGGGAGRGGGGGGLRGCRR